MINWTVAGVVIAITLFIAQPYYNGCNKSAQTSEEPKTDFPILQPPTTVKKDTQSVKKNSNKVILDAVKPKATKPAK